MATHTINGTELFVDTVARAPRSSSSMGGWASTTPISGRGSTNSPTRTPSSTTTSGATVAHDVRTTTARS